MRYFILICSVLFLFFTPPCLAVNITWADKATGQGLYATEVNETKAAVNSKPDYLIGKYGDTPPAGQAIGTLWFPVCNAFNAGGLAANYITLTDFPWSDFQGDFTITYRGILSLTGDHQGLVYRRNNDTGNSEFGLAYLYTTETLAFRRTPDGASRVSVENGSSVASYFDDAEHTIVVTFSSTDGAVSFTIDGTDVGTATIGSYDQAVSTTATPFTIAAFGNATSYAAGGAIFEVALSSPTAGTITYTLDEGTDTISGYVDGVATYSGTVSGTDVWEDICD
jgi:hypothetical protein